MSLPETNLPKLFVDTGKDSEGLGILPKNEEQIPFLRISEDSSGPSTRISDSSDPLSHIKPVNKALKESRKLLAISLEQLQNRTLPDPVFCGSISTNDPVARRFVETVKEVVGLGGKKDNGSAIATDEEDEEKQTTFSTDATFELLVQLKEILIVSLRRGWEIFNDELTQIPGFDRKGESYRKPRHSLQPLGRRSRSPSPRPGSHYQASELLIKCTSVLASIISEDCRFQTFHPKPSHPPNALQALALDVAQFIVYSQRNDPKVVSQIGYAIIPAFSTFHSSMLPRLLGFFENCILRPLLDNLNESLVSPSLKSKYDGNSDDFNTPGVAICVDEVEDEVLSSPGTQQWKPWSKAGEIGLRSANAPLQPLSVYYLASLVTPLLAAVFERIDPHLESDSTLILGHRFYHLLGLITSSKHDSYNNFLEVLAYHTPRARYAAALTLASLWPRALGHLVVSRPFPVFNQRPVDPRISIRKAGHHPYDHQFVPWRFPPLSQSSRSGQYDCRSCFTPIRDFGLLCPFCTCAVHFECYDWPLGSYTSQYAALSDPTIQKVSIYRFCYLAPSRLNLDPVIFIKENHRFRRINLFTLCLCAICRLPLWGCFGQAYRCGACNFFVHPSCLRDQKADLPSCGSVPFDSSFVNIDWALLRRSFANHYGEILFSQEQIDSKSFEDVSVFNGVLWSQLQILNKGVALGSIVVNQKRARLAKEKKFEEFELQYLARLYDANLSSRRLPVSSILDDFLQNNSILPADFHFMFDWTMLVYMTTVIKSPFEAHREPSPNLLSISTTDSMMDDDQITNQSSFQTVSLSYLRDALGFEFNLHSDTAARFLLAHLHHLGFFERCDGEVSLFDGEAVGQLQCVFPLPQGLDTTTDVETLVSAVEACLSDLDLSVNETGFLLLVRKLWPCGMTSEYASRRLTRNVLSWILSEDDNLATILREQLAKQQRLPGVRTALEPPSWPSNANTRMALVSSVNNGGDYVFSRRLLLSRYVTPWLLALHDRDSPSYAQMVFELSQELVEDKNLADSVENENSKDDAEAVLRFIVKLSNSSVTFTVLDSLVKRWLELMVQLNLFLENIPTLLRLFPREGETNHLTSADGDQDFFKRAQSDLNPWRVVMATARKGKVGLLQSSKWLCLFAKSGVEIPISAFEEIFALAESYQLSYSEMLDILMACVFSLWLQSIGRQDLLQLFYNLHQRLAPEVTEGIRHEEGKGIVFLFIRYSLLSCSLLFGCERGSLISLGMVSEAEISGLPSRRKIGTRGRIASDPIIIRAQLTNALGEYLHTRDERITGLLAKFFTSFVNESSLLEAFEIDNFIHQNVVMLSTSAWEFYGLQTFELSSIRTAFLLRILVTDNGPFQGLVQEALQPGVDCWEKRLLAVTRLFRIILDVTSPSFNVEGRQWRSSVTEIFYFYFSAIWADDREEVRLAAETWSRTLLPAHFEAISSCWNESLVKSPVTERAKLISFLVHLRPHFPNWRVLSWSVMIEALLEDDYDQRNTGNEDGPASAHLSMYGLSSPKIDSAERENFHDPELASLRVSLLLLNLQMIADGISIDLFSLLKVKYHLVKLLGFSDASVVPAATGPSFYVRFGEMELVPELSIPCLHELLTVLDAPCPFEIAPSAFEGPHSHEEVPVSLLVGTVFVDVVLAVFTQAKSLDQLPVLTLKSLLESLIVIIYKHDLDARPLVHLQPIVRVSVRRAMEITLKDVSYELRQLALSAVQSYIKRYPSSAHPVICDSIVGAVKILLGQNQYIQDALAAQAKISVGSMLRMYPSSFNALCKRDLPSDFFLILKQILDSDARTSQPAAPLREILIRDVLARTVENDYNTFQGVLNNISTFIHIAFHQGYSAELMQFVGISLSNLVRRTSEWTVGAFDPTPLLKIPAILIQHNKSNSRDLLFHTETIFRVTLTRFGASAGSISSLLRATTKLGRKVILPGQSPDVIAAAHFEILGDGLRMKLRVLPLTISNMLEAVAPGPNAQNYASYHLDSYLALADSGIYFLQNHLWTDVNTENDFVASLSVSKLVLEATARQPETISCFPPEQQTLGVRAWNILALTALLNSKETWASTLFMHLSAVSYAVYVSLQVYFQTNTSPPETAIADINHTFIAFKLWLMLAQMVSKSKGSHRSRIEDKNWASSVWNEFWPPFESLLGVLEKEAHTGTSALVPVTWSSVADLLVFIRQLRSPLTIDTSTHSNILSRLQSSGADSLKGKLSRAKRSLHEPPPEMPFDLMVNQAGKEIIAAEKFANVNTRKGGTSGVPQTRVAQERHK